ncbi:MAG TPA: RNA polymerase sigma-70 factor [Puia sp.]|nr:RNA polymerase sigma-70 factor [Puia sp.]
MEVNDLFLVGSGVQADEQIFEKLFVDWYSPLHAYACSVLKDESLAAEAVQTVFTRLWEKREQLRVQASVKAYLYGSVYHECISWMRRERTRREYRSGVLRRLGGQADRSLENASDKAEVRELEQQFQRALDELPEQCKAIFQLSRFSELKYREIAEQLGISVKTVETQMTKALKLLRRKLADYLE